MITYKLIKSFFNNEITGVIKIIDNVRDKQIGWESNSSGWFEYQEWLAEGNEPLPADEPE